MIETGADVNQQDEQGWTPLNFAAGKGDLSLVKLLVEKGADIFKVGRDQRTPYMIALAAGRVSVVKYLREMEDEYPGEKPERPERKYCKAYPLGDLRKHSSWSESRVNWKEKDAGNNGNAAGRFTDEKIVFIHQDFTTETGKSAGASLVEGQCGKLIISQREKKGISRKDLAEKIQISITDMESIEEGSTALETYAPLLLSFAEIIDQPIFNLFYPCGLPLDKLTDYP